MTELDKHGDVSLILEAVNSDEPGAESRLMEVVYEELKRLASSKIARESPNNSLNATGLVHEAYLRLLGTKSEAYWNSRGHFFGAAAEAMRRILIDRARSKNRQKRSGNANLVDIQNVSSIADERLNQFEDLVKLDGAIDRLKLEDPELAKLILLRFFSGFTTNQAADALDISIRTANRRYRYAKARLQQMMED